MNQIQINFPPGEYSSKKDEIKEIFKTLGYKYSFHESKPNTSTGKLLTVWRKNKEEVIKAFFEGSGKACHFVISCNEQEVLIFDSLSKFYNCEVVDFDESSKIEKLRVKAKQLIDSWWTPIKPNPKEPEYFYIKRLEKSMDSYNEWIEWQTKALKEDYVAY